VEGETDDSAINALRRQQQRNFLTTLLLSQGVPMIAHGDEIGRTQGGNNNVYCQDNELSWIDWKLAEDEAHLLAFTSAVVSLRQDHAVFRRRRFFAGDAAHGGQSALGDIEWFSSDGTEMDENDWQNGYARTLMAFLNGDAIPEPDPRGERILDSDFLLLFNAHSEPVNFALPPAQYGAGWRVRLDTAVAEPSSVTEQDWIASTSHAVAGRSMVVLESEPAAKN
jgi:glycogen operon protein